MTAEWFYASDGQQKGPVTEAELRALRADSTIQPHTLVWKEGLANWQAFSEALPELREPTPPPAPGRPLHPDEEIAQLPFPQDIPYCNFTLLICWSGAGLILLALGSFGFLAPIIFPSPLPDWSAGAATTLLILGAICLFILWIMSLKFLYRAWKLLTPFNPSTTPGMAVGLLFVPLFALYWNFRAYWNWAKEYNTMVENTPPMTMAPKASPWAFLGFPIAATLDTAFDLLGNFAGSSGFEILSAISGFFTVISLVCGIVTIFQMGQAVNFVLSARKRAEEISA